METTDRNLSSGRRSDTALVLAADAVVAILSVQVAVAGPGAEQDASPAAVSNKKFKKLKKRVTDLESKQAIPAKTVAFFNQASCPSGWSELTAARGRYIVGLPSGGALGGTAGTALTNLENRPIGQHTHGVNDPGHVHNHNYPFGDADVPEAGAQAFDAAAFVRLVNVATASSVTGLTVNAEGAVAGTNAPYIQLLACEKS